MPLASPLVLYCDNISTINLASNPVLHSRTKHVEVDQHFFREKVTQKALVLAYVSSTDQLADCLTKPLVVSRFQELSTKLTVLPRPMSLRGDVKHVRVTFLVITLHVLLPFC